MSSAKTARLTQVTHHASKVDGRLMSWGRAFRNEGLLNRSLAPASCVPVV